LKNGLNHSIHLADHAANTSAVHHVATPIVASHVLGTHVATPINTI